MLATRSGGTIPSNSVASRSAAWCLDCNTSHCLVVIGDLSSAVSERGYPPAVSWASTTLARRSRAKRSSASACLSSAAVVGALPGVAGAAAGGGAAVPGGVAGRSRGAACGGGATAGGGGDPAGAGAKHLIEGLGQGGGVADPDSAGSAGFSHAHQYAG